MNILGVKDFVYDGKLFNFPNTFSKEFKSFLMCSLQLEPEKRSQASILLDHPFIKQSEKVSKEYFKEWLSTVTEKANKKRTKINSEKGKK